MVGDSGGDSIVASELRIGEIDLRSFGGGGVGDSIRGDRYAAFGPSGPGFWGNWAPLLAPQPIVIGYAMCSIKARWNAMRIQRICAQLSTALIVIAMAP